MSDRIELDKTYLIYAKKSGAKRALILAGDHLTRLRIYAIMYVMDRVDKPDLLRNQLEQLRKDNPDFEWSVRAIR